MQIIKPPETLNIKFKEHSLFLAGSIEMGKAENWQDRITKAFEGIDDIVILNPRRDDWDRKKRLYRAANYYFMD